MTNHFEPDERLFRSVRPEYWREDGTLDSNAFRWKKGLSVDRDGGRPYEEAAEFLYSRIQGTIISVSAGSCQENSVLIRYRPSHEDIWHCEIHGSETKIQLSLKQAAELAKPGNYTIHRYPD